MTSRPFLCVLGLTNSASWVNALGLANSQCELGQCALGLANSQCELGQCTLGLANSEFGESSIIYYPYTWFFFFFQFPVGIGIQ